MYIYIGKCYLIVLAACKGPVRHFHFCIFFEGPSALHIDKLIHPHSWKYLCNGWQSNKPQNSCKRIRGGRGLRSHRSLEADDKMRRTNRGQWKLIDVWWVVGADEYFTQTQLQFLYIEHHRICIAQIVALFRFGTLMCCRFLRSVRMFP